MDIRDLCRLFLWYILYNIGGRKAEICSKGSIGRTSFNECIKLVFQYLKGFEERFFDPLGIEDRLKISEHTLPPDYCRITMLMDCVHSPVVSTSLAYKNKYYSDKLRTSAINTLVCTLTNMKVIFVSNKSEACGTRQGNDINLFKNNIKKISKVIKGQGDIMLADKAFAHNSLANLTMQNGFFLTTGIRISSLEYNGDESYPYNIDLQMIRSPIERLFGILKKKFSVLFKKFRHRELMDDVFNLLFKTCCALYNIHYFYSDEELESDYYDYHDSNDLNTLFENSTRLSRAIAYQNELFIRKGIMIDRYLPSDDQITEEEEIQNNHSEELNGKFEIEETNRISDFINEIRQHPDAPIASIKRSFLHIVEILKDSSLQKDITKSLKKISNYNDLISFIESLLNKKEQI